MNDRSMLQTLTLLLGIVFLAVGILGFIPGITTHYGDLSFAGDDSASKLLGIFQVSVLHNLSTSCSASSACWAARGFDSSRIYMLGGGDHLPGAVRARPVRRARAGSRRTTPTTGSTSRSAW